MKYKVSLLPEKNRKRIIGKRKAEKGRGVANVFMLVLLAALFIALLGKTVADTKLKEAHEKNAPYESEILALQEVENVNNALNAKLQLIESIKVQEPALYNFIAKFANVENAGVTYTSVTCTEWKTTRSCVVTGKAVSYDSYKAFITALEEVEGVSSVVQTSLSPIIATGNDCSYEFSITIICSGGAAPITTAPSTTAASTETTAAQ